MPRGDSDLGFELVGQRAGVVQLAEHLDDGFAVYRDGPRALRCRRRSCATRLSMLPSKIKPDHSPSRLTTGDPELPPMMSLVVTKFSGGEFERDPCRTSNRCGRS